MTTGTDRRRHDLASWPVHACFWALQALAAGLWAFTPALAAHAAMSATASAAVSAPTCAGAPPSAACPAASLPARAARASGLPSGTPAPSPSADSATPTEAQLARWSLIASQTGRDSDAQDLRHWARQGLPAAQREWGWALMKMGREAEALPWLAQAGRQGDTQASFWQAGVVLREAARQGLTLPAAARPAAMAKAQRQARQCLEQAARQGHADAALQLSQLLASAPSAAQRQQAQAWLKRAAQSGQPQAQFLLAMSLMPHAGGTAQAHPLAAAKRSAQSWAEALHWLEQAADQHHGPALQALALWRESQAAGLATPDPTHQQAIDDLWREAREEARNRWHR